MALNFYALPAVLIVATLASAPAFAVPSRAGDDPPFGASGLTSVPAIEGRGWLLRFSVRSLYDSNIRRLGTSQQLPPGLQRSDLLTTPSIEGAIALPVGRQQAFIGAQFGRDFYAKNTVLNRNRYRIGGGVNLRAGSRCTGAIGAEFSSRQVQVSDIAALQAGVQDTLNYGGEANCQAGAGLGFGGSVRRVQFRNSEPSRQLFDLDSTVFAPQISYALPVLGRFSLGGSYNQTRYNRRQVFQTDGSIVDDGVDIISGRVGFSRQLGSRLSINIGGSYLRAAPRPGTIVVFPGPGLPPAAIDREAFTGAGYDGSIAYRAGARLTATVQAGRDVRASPNVGAQYSISENYGLDLDYRLGRAITVGTGVTYNYNRYSGSFINANEPIRRLNDRLTRVYGSVSYAPVKLYRVSLEVAHQNRQSLPTIFSYRSTSVLLNLNVNFGRS